MGLDEAYLELTGLERYRAAARSVKDAVRAETGLVCSIGIGPSKLVAKVASDADKPDGFLALTAADARERFGIGLARTRARDRPEDGRAARAPGRERRCRHSAPPRTAG